jgi:hypothetical protein
MKKTILSVLLGTSFLLVGASSISAQAPTAGTTAGITQSVSGDEVCGGASTSDDPAANKCTANDFKEIGKRLLVIFTMLGGAVLVIMIAVRLVMSWYAYRSGDAGAIKRAGEQAFNAAMGFLIIFAVFGGLYLALLNYLGTQEWTVQLFKLFSDMLVPLVPHAYAAPTASPTADQLLPNAFGSNSAYDILLAGINLGMRFFVYPAIIVMWVWSGFQFVYSRGNPDGLTKAKSWLFWAFIITVVAIMLQGFLIAFKNTANKVLGNTSAIVVTTRIAAIQGRELW